MGVSIFVFVYEKMPFWGETDQEIVEGIKNKELEFPEEVPVSDEFKEMLIALMSKDPEQRPSIREAKQRFEWL